MSFKEEYTELAELIADPERSIPSLLNEDIRLILVQAILAYIERKIHFETLDTVVKLIKEYSSISFSADVNESLEDIADIQRHHHIIDEILSDSLEELTAKTSFNL